MTGPETGIAGRVFVVGVPRSGTTLVQSLLAAHGDVTSFTESHLFDRHFTLLPLSARAVLTRDPGPRLREFLAENDAVPPPAAAWFAAGRPRPVLPFHTARAARRLLGVLDELAAGRGAAVWVEKTPRHLRYLPFLERLAAAGPPTRFVHVVRDGLDVVASLRAASRGWERSYALEECARRWNGDVAFSLGRVGSANDRFVLYEELTADPEAVLRRLVAGLGLDWQPEMLERYGVASGDLVTAAEEGWKGGVDQPIARPSGARTGLTAEERRRVKRLLRPGLYDELRGRVGRLAAEGAPP